MTPWYSLEEKTIWVIGGAGYFGSAITTALDSLCRQAVCLDLENRAAELVRRENLGRTAPETLDVSQVERLPAAVEALMAKHGVPDGVVNLATASSGNTALADLSPDTFQRVIGTNVVGTFALCRTLAEKMRGRGSGSIVLFSSMYGVIAPEPRIYERPMAPNPIDYGASKAALLQLARYFAVHYAPAGLRFNCITPGAFPHPGLQKSSPDFIQRLGRKAPMGRIGRDAEIVGPTLFLLTDSASFVTGHGLPVDGGWTIW